MIQFTVCDPEEKLGKVNLAAEDTPAFIDGALNLEFLILDDSAPDNIFSYIMKMKKLKYLKLPLNTFGVTHDFFKTSNLEYLSGQ